VVKDTEYFSRDEAIPGLGREDTFLQAAFSLDPGQVSDVIRGKKGYYLLQLIGKKDPEAPSFEQVRDRVEERFRRAESIGLARNKAEEVLEMARSGTSLDELAEQEGIESLDTGLFNRLGKFVPRIGVSQELLETAFTLTNSNPWPDRVFEVNGQLYVVCFKEREEPSHEAFLAEKETLRVRQEREKEQEVLREWLSELRKQQNVKISVLGT
jgi:peptidyl-prolyl cis-trans isomerase D